MESKLQNDDDEVATFYLAPAQPTWGVIDYRTVERRKPLEKSIAKLGEDQFDSTAEDSHLFLDTLHEREQEMAWELQGVGIAEIVLDPINPDSDLVNMLNNHGKVTLEQIQQFEATHIATK